MKNIQHFIEMKHSLKKPVEQVTKKEFINAMIAIGETEEKAKQTAFFCEKLGGSTKIGDRMLQIKSKSNKIKKPRKIASENESNYQIKQQSTNHKHICINNVMMSFIEASQLIRKKYNLGVTQAMDYVDDLPWRE